MAKLIIDSDHSVLGFAIRHMMIAKVRGQFNKIKGTINYDQSDIGNSSVELEVDVSSIYTGIKKRDEHLRSSDFFDVEKYPKITFKSKSVEPAGENRLKVIGDLTMHGVTRRISIDIDCLGPVKSPFGDERSMGFCGHTKINRMDFGVAWNELMEDGNPVAGSEVEINLDIEADLAE